MTKEKYIHYSECETCRSYEPQEKELPAAPIRKIKTDRALTNAEIEKQLEQFRPTMGGVTRETRRTKERQKRGGNYSKDR